MFNIRELNAVFQAMTDDEIYTYHVLWLEQLIELSSIECGEIYTTTNDEGISVPTVTTEFGTVMSVQSIYKHERVAMNCFGDGEAHVNIVVDGHPYIVRVGIDMVFMGGEIRKLNIIGFYEPGRYLNIVRGVYTQQQKRSREIGERFWALPESDKFEYSSKLLMQITSLLGLECETPSVRLINEYVKEGYVSTLDKQGRLHALKQPSCLFFSIIGCNYSIPVIFDYTTINGYGYSVHIDIDDSPLPNIISIRDIERYQKLLIQEKEMDGK